MSETIVNWVIEFQRPDSGSGTWLTWPAPVDEDGARSAFEERRQAHAHGRTRARWQLVRRTATYTDDVKDAFG